MEHLVERNRPHQIRVFWQRTAFILLTCAVLCFTVLGAVAQQSPAQQEPTTTEQAPATTQQPSTAQAPAMTEAPASAAQSQATPDQQADLGPQTVHIVVGHSLLIHTPSRIKRILTGNPAVVESVLTSPRELVITAKTPGGSSLMLWDESGQNRTLDVYADLDVTQ